ncbi:MAG: hypothetical protein Q7T82_03710 [Armatimonadota bacterium]|nr:hypothetical protein [Armatimonadota bacterium]
MKNVPVTVVQICDDVRADPARRLAVITIVEKADKEAWPSEEDYRKAPKRSLTLVPLALRKVDGRWLIADKHYRTTPPAE